MNGTHPEIILVPESEHQVACNGGGGALGHPRVYYSFDGRDDITCSYCSRLFTKTPQPGATAVKDVA